MLESGECLQQRYRILQRIGGGGMGTVYLAEDERLEGRRCAIKEMSPAVLASEDREWSIEAFRQEAQLLAQLRHPGLTAVTDFFPDSGNWYLVMDYVAGETLEERLSKQPGRRFTVDEALRVTQQLLDVLIYLHSQPSQVIFRDLKPSNVMCTPDGTIKLIDFGIARFFKPGKAQDTALLGTPGYAAPEQFGRMGQTDTRTDIYGLGVLLHQMVTGFDPSAVASPFPVPDPRIAMPSTPLRIAQVIQRATQLRPELRYTSVAEMQSELFPAPSSFVPYTSTRVMPQSAGVPPRVEQPKRGMSGIWLGLGVAALGALLCGGTVAGAYWLGLFPLSPGATKTPAPLVSQPTPEPTAEPTAEPTTSHDAGGPSSSPTPTRTAQPVATATATAPLLISERIVFGHSVMGKALEATVMGYDGGIPIVVVGSIQGDQLPTQTLVEALAAYYAQDYGRVPEDTLLYLISSINPDGNAAGSRYNANGVDLNRNWATDDWLSSAAVPGYPDGKTGSGGSYPFSESETVALRDLIVDLRRRSPELKVVIVHSSVSLSEGEVYPGGVNSERIASAYSAVTGYRVETSWAQYTTSGEAVTWCSENDIVAIDIVFPAKQTPTTVVYQGVTLLQATLDGLRAITN